MIASDELEQLDGAAYRLRALYAPTRSCRACCRGIYAVHYMNIFERFAKKRTEIVFI